MNRKDFAEHNWQSEFDEWNSRQISDEAWTAIYVVALVVVTAMFYFVATQ